MVITGNDRFALHGANPKNVDGWLNVINNRINFMKAVNDEKKNEGGGNQSGIKASTTKELLDHGLPQSIAEVTSINVEGAGESSVNGTYTLIGIKNRAPCYKNALNISITREFVSGKYGWILGVSPHALYVNSNSIALLPPSTTDWKAIKGSHFIYTFL